MQLSASLKPRCSGMSVYPSFCGRLQCRRAALLVIRKIGGWKVFKKRNIGHYTMFLTATLSFYFYRVFLWVRGLA